MAVVSVARPAFAGAAVDGAAIAPAGNSVVVTAKSTTSETPSARFALGSIAFVIIAFVATFLAEGWLRAPLKLATDMGAFALIYVAAQGIERMLEPFTHYILPVADDKKAAKDHLESVMTANSQQSAAGSATEAANKLADVNRKTKERAILFWCAASLLGIVASAWLGLQFISIVLDESSRNAIPRWFDVAFTGFVVGGGTKVLHGLVERIGKPAEPTAT